MLDEKNIQAFKKIMDEQSAECTNRMKVLTESEITPKLNLLADGQNTILRK